MASGLYQEQMKQGIMGQFSEFMKNPMQFLLSKRVNIPSQYANDPQAAVNYLISSGQMDQATFERLRSQATQMGIKL